MGTNAGAGQRAEGEVRGDVASSLLFGRSGVRADRTVGGSDGQAGPSRPQGQYLGTNVQTSGTNVQNSGVSGLIERDAMIADLQRQVRELQQQNNVRGPPPRTPTAPAAMGNSEVLQAAGSTEANPVVIPDRFGSQIRLLKYNRGDKMDIQRL